MEASPILFFFNKESESLSIFPVWVKPSATLWMAQWTFYLSQVRHQCDDMTWGECFRAVVGLSNGIKNAQIGHKLTELWQFKVCPTLTNLSEGSLINAILIRQHELLIPRSNCFKLQSWSRTCVLTKLGYDEYPTMTSTFQNTCYSTSK